MSPFKRKLFLNIGISTLVVLILLATIWLLASDISKRVKAIQEARAEQRFHIQAVEMLASLKKDAQQAKTVELLLSTRLPAQDQLIDFPKDINNFAKQYGVNAEFAFGQETKGNESTPGHITFTATASAPLSNWLEFIKAIENSRYFVSFDSFNLVRDDKIFKSVINGKVYSQ